ncbi:U2 small nuclear ribonucleoprotein auxiliary factor 35 kDa subunit-related protein 2 [Schistocerca cancellata]|uniref:U2 small nuclear ribonucleoprotein auxiliary factor 35 kDa subunit-related protein 2 n=1 Tax=Schistocerca cancellata TaxID=274614 RepID=UPI002119B17B|nr:U2 small nuclear ribonucleoprotein auxiliary factor 35 kDa subunit-related protein 2 [Schistocerca cancellata]
MGRHKLWRAHAKKMRRKRIRQRIAQERDALLQKEQEEREKSPRYQTWKASQEELEKFQEEEEARLHQERHKTWEEDEAMAQKLWQERQEHLARVKKEKEQQELLIRQEWEEQQRKEREAEEAERKLKEEKQRKQDELLKQIDDFINKGGDMPQAINVSTETNPDKPLCPFFTKTGACRFGDRCSRNHPRPGISKVLLIPNFYSHFGMDQSMADEYDTDVLLEYEDSETYQHFKDFYEDVLPEFETFGPVVQFKVCCNFESHLRGNVYIEYANIRHAVAAFQKFHGRWYGGRQLNVEFTCVSSWKSALCGLFFKGKCPKGRSCNFLHVFRNPSNQFAWADRDFQHYRQRKRHRSRSRSPSSSFSPKHNGQRNREERNNWRWSESPEPIDRSEKRNATKEKQDKASSHHNSKKKRSKASHRHSSSASSSSSRNDHRSRDHKRKRHKRSRSLSRSRSRS